MKKKFKINKEKFEEIKLDNKNQENLKGGSTGKRYIWTGGELMSDYPGGPTTGMFPHVISWEIVY